MNTVKKITQNELFVKMVVSSWDLHNKRVSDLLAKITEEQLYAEVAPGRNRGIYLLGHLVAITDALMPLFGAGDRLYQELELIFLKSPDQADQAMPSVADLKEYWVAVNQRFSMHIKHMPAEDWFSKHTAVSEEDFEKEPYRNKLNLLISRTAHEAYHLGQMVFLAPR